MRRGRCFNGGTLGSRAAHRVSLCRSKSDLSDLARKDRFGQIVRLKTLVLRGQLNPGDWHGGARSHLGEKTRKEAPDGRVVWLTYRGFSGEAER